MRDKLRISDIGVSLITGFEGIELEAYRDIAGIWTIGVGHTGQNPPVVPGMKITEAEAILIFKWDVLPAEAAINDGVEPQLTQNQFDALVSLIFNIGVGAFRDSTVRKRINDTGPNEFAAKAILWWNKATIEGQLKEVRGLTRRRTAEYNLFLEQPFAASKALNDFQSENNNWIRDLLENQRELRAVHPVEIQPLYERVLGKLKTIGKL